MLHTQLQLSSLLPLFQRLLASWLIYQTRGHLRYQWKEWKVRLWVVFSCIKELDWLLPISLHLTSLLLSPAVFYQSQERVERCQLLCLIFPSSHQHYWQPCFHVHQWPTKTRENISLKWLSNSWLARRAHMWFREVGLCHDFHRTTSNHASPDNNQRGAFWLKMVLL